MSIPGGLPRGRHGLERAFVVTNQHDRILDAFAETVDAKGYSAVTVSEVIAAAGVSRKTFYELFSDKQACFLACYEAGLAVLMERVGQVYLADPAASPDRAHAVLGALLNVLAAEPAFAQLGMVEVLAVGPAAVARHRQVIASFIPLLKVASEYHDTLVAGLPKPDPIILEALVGGIVAVISGRIRDGRTQALPDLLIPLSRFLLAPFVGEVRAAQIAAEHRSASTSAAVQSEAADTGAEATRQTHDL